MISPFAPHISEQLWEMLNNKEYVFNAKWPGICRGVNNKF